MTYLKLVDIKGLGSAYLEKLALADITSTQSLFDKCTTPQGRKEISEKSSISLGLILRWVEKISIIRIEGIGLEFWRLLQASKIDSVEKLASQDPKSLLQLVEQINHNNKIMKRNPSLWEVENWISQARNLPQMIQHSYGDQPIIPTRLPSLKPKIPNEGHLIYYLERLKQKIPSQRLQNHTISHSFSGTGMGLISQRNRIQRLR